MEWRTEAPRPASQHAIDRNGLGRDAILGLSGTRRSGVVRSGSFKLGQHGRAGLESEWAKILSVERSAAPRAKDGRDIAAGAGQVDEIPGLRL
jgi:hypothetical protein